MKKQYVYTAILGLSLIGFVTNASAAKFADVAFVIDQSGSMGGEFNWLGQSISDIDAGLTGITSKYGVAGYETLAGSASPRNVWQDFSSDINDVVNAVNSKGTYGGTERGYQAADWATDNFSWTGGDYAKVMVLITDEDSDDANSYTYDGLVGEAALGKKMSDNNILLNVITSTNLYSVWDDAVYTKGTYSGLFDLNYLRTDATGFTTDFTAAKLAEIQNVPTDPVPTNPVPEPSTVLLFGLGLAGLAGYSRKKAKK